VKVKNVYLHTKGRKWPRISIEFADGSTRSTTLRVDVEIAKDIRRNIRHQIYLGTFVITDYFDNMKAPSPLFGDFRERYLKHRKSETGRGNISINTYDLDKDSLNVFQNIAGNLKLSQIDINVINKFVDKLKITPTKRNKHYMPASINIYLNMLQSAFSWAKDHHLTSENPFMGFPRQKTKKKERRYLKDKEISALRKYFATRNEWCLDAFDLTLWTGIRESGILSLKSQEKYTKKFDDKEVHLISTTEKGDEDRPIPLSNQANEIIEKRMEWLKDEKQIYSVIANTAQRHMYTRCLQRAKDGYLFFEITNRNAISHLFSKARRKIHIADDISWHSLRHSFATYYLENGGSLEALKEILGHANIKTTEIYAQVTEKKITKMIDEYADI